MPRLAMLPTLFREVFLQAVPPREPEPDLIMEDAAQTAAYAHAGRIDGTMAAAYVFQTAHATGAIAGSRRVLDLGCGPGTQLAQIAELNPDTQFLGVDLSKSMLELAQRHVEAKGIANVRFEQGDMTNLEMIPSGSIDAVVSFLALHHLPDVSSLNKCFREIRRVLRAGGALYVVDFCRLKSRRSMAFFANMNAGAQPELFTTDYHNSLRAAFTREELSLLVDDQLSADARVYTTSMISLLSVIKTPYKQLTSETRERLRQLRGSLPPRHRKDLEEMRLFFRMGGLREDPFDS